MSEPQFITSTIMVDIPEFTEKYIDGKTVTFYTINVNDNFSKQKWTIDKRYSEFEQLHKELITSFANAANEKTFQAQSTLKTSSN